MAMIFDARTPQGEADFRARVLRERAPSSDLVADVAALIARVRREGVAALVELTARFDGLGIDPVTLKSEAVDLERLARACPDDLKAAIDFAHDRIAAYHEAQRPVDRAFTDAAGVGLGWRWTPLDAVGVYVPGGRASYPSSVLMNVVPARLAGVARIVMVAPARGGELSPAVAYAARKAGVTEFWPIGGAQAVAALAYGCGPIAPVDKITGPGNAWVAEAKRQVFGQVGIDMIAGPSEILVISDAGSDPSWIAADLLSQCEHDPSSQAVLLTDDAAFAGAVARAVERHLETLATRETAGTAWARNGAIAVTATLADAARLSDLIAPEHLELAVEDPDVLLGLIRHAGAVFLGRQMPEALGDYVTGSNHVLPTSRTARFASGLGLTDFMKRTSIQRAGAEGLAALAPAALRLAEAEGLPAHALSVAVRTNRGAA
jgi:histidinol dehydrogenase